MKKQVVVFYVNESNEFFVVNALLPKKKLKYGASVRKIFDTKFNKNEVIYLGFL